MTLFPHGRLVVCRPTYFDVTYEINPWMSTKRVPHPETAKIQWHALHHTFIRLGAWLDYVEPQKGLPDMVFTANAGLTHKNKAILARFRHSERQGEEVFFRDWFKGAGFEVHELTSGSFEGEGDALRDGETFFGGYGFRTDRAVFDEIKSILNLKTFVACELTDPRFYHLDTCFFPFTPGKALYFPGAFSPDSVKEMKKHIELIPLPEGDAVRFACNSVVIGNSIVTPAGCDEARKILERERFQVHQFPLDEFLKAGGAAKCLCIRVDWP